MIGSHYEVLDFEFGARKGGDLRVTLLGHPDAPFP